VSIDHLLVPRQRTVTDMGSRIWHQYNCEPIQGWKMFRTASMAWETYNLKHAHGKTQRTKQEESECAIPLAIAYILRC
jgi:hypothetical protein